MFVGGSGKFWENGAQLGVVVILGQLGKMEHSCVCL